MNDEPLFLSFCCYWMTGWLQCFHAMRYFVAGLSCFLLYTLSLAVNKRFQCFSSFSASNDLLLNMFPRCKLCHWADCVFTLHCSIWSRSPCRKLGLLLNWKISLLLINSLSVARELKYFEQYVYKKLSYHRETARQLPTWRGLGYIYAYGRIWNPPQTYVQRAVHLAHFKMNRAFKVMQGHILIGAGRHPERCVVVMCN